MDFVQFRTYVQTVDQGLICNSVQPYFKGKVNGTVSKYESNSINTSLLGQSILYLREEKGFKFEKDNIYFSHMISQDQSKVEDVLEFLKQSYSD